MFLQKKDREVKAVTGGAFPFNFLEFRDNKVKVDRYVYEEGVGILFYNGEPVKENLVYIGFGFEEPALVSMNSDSYHYYMKHKTDKTKWLYLKWEELVPFPTAVGGNCLLQEWTFRIGHRVGQIAAKFREAEGRRMTVAEKVMKFEELAKEASSMVVVKRNLHDQYVLISINGKEEWRPVERLVSVEKAIQVYGTYQKEKWGKFDE